VTVTASPNALVAAAALVTKTSQVTKLRKDARAWQDRSWEMYDLVGEFRYAADWTGAMLSKATLYIEGPDGTRITEGPAVDLLDALYGGPQNHGAMLGGIGVNWTVAGDCYLVGVERKGRDFWRTASATSLTARGGKFYIDRDLVESDGDVLVMRLWRPHPRKYNEATAPARAVIPILNEIDTLTRRVAAEADSRLTGAGLLLVPDTIQFPANPNSTGDETNLSTADRFMLYMQEIMAMAIANPESASATVPVAVTMPPEAIEAVKHLTFWSPLDENGPKLREEGIKRLALGLDMPPEVLTGSADLNHWNAWAVDDAAIKACAEPLLNLIVGALTEGYLYPLLVDMGMVAEEAAGFSIKADTSKIRMRPNRSKEAMELYDRGALSLTAVLRENGFEDGDAPTSEEFRQWMLRKVASGSTTPEQVAAALLELGIVLPTQAEAPADETQEARPVPSLLEHPVNDPPEEPGIGDNALLFAAEQIVFRALERAGNRLKSKMTTRPPGVSAADLYQYVPCDAATINDVLTDAWTQVERFDFGIPADVLSQALDSYCRALLAGRQPHDRDLLASYLSLIRVPA